MNIHFKNDLGLLYSISIKEIILHIRPVLALYEDNNVFYQYNLNFSLKLLELK